MEENFNSMLMDVEELKITDRPSKKRKYEPFKILENFNNDNLIDNSLNIATVMLLSSYGVLYDGKSSTPINKISDNFKAILMFWYYNKTNGCFLITNSSIKRLDGCSDWYGSSLKNQLNCSCGKIANSLNKPICDTEECFKPYCIGNDNCNKSISKCSDDQLYQCTGDNMSDPNFIYYTYKNNSILSVYNNLFTLQNLFSSKNSNKNNILIYLFIFISIILFIIGILYLLKKKKIKKY